MTREGELNERKAYVIAQESVNLVVCLCRCKKKAYETTSRIILKQTPIENEILKYTVRGLDGHGHF